jgi:hypothetical protein
MKSMAAGRDCGNSDAVTEHSVGESFYEFGRVRLVDAQRRSEIIQAGACNIALG